MSGVDGDDLDAWRNWEWWGSGREAIGGSSRDVLVLVLC